MRAHFILMLTKEDKTIVHNLLAFPSKSTLAFLKDLMTYLTTWSTDSKIRMLHQKMPSLVSISILWITRSHELQAYGSLLWMPHGRDAIFD